MRFTFTVLSAAFAALACGCAGGVVAGAAGATVLGGEAPSQELEQVYYLGVFDPHEQVPEAVYRITVRGQASGLSGMRFASDWVPAKFIDSLTSSVGSASNPTTNPVIDKGNDQFLSNINTGRRLVMFGPEGFRDAPRDHRLVIVMGASPEAFFSAIDLSLGALAGSKVKQAEPLNSVNNSNVYQALASALARRQSLNDLRDEVRDEFGSGGE